MRVLFVVAVVVSGGVAVVLYALGWIFMDEGEPPAASDGQPARVRPASRAGQLEGGGRGRVPGARAAARDARGRVVVVRRAGVAADPRRRGRGAAVATVEHQRSARLLSFASGGGRVRCRTTHDPRVARRGIRLPRRLRRGARARRGVALPVRERRARPGPRRGARDRRRDPCAGAHPRPVPLAARPQPGLRARRADPLPGARRGRGPPPRLRAADADLGAEARRRPARGRPAGSPPGARAARVAL